MTKVKLLRGIDKVECARRNALSRTAPNYVLSAEQIGELVETLDDGNAFLVEFGQDQACDWLGVLYAAEIELQPSGAVAA